MRPPNNVSQKPLTQSQRRQGFLGAQQGDGLFEGGKGVAQFCLAVGGGDHTAAGAVDIDAVQQQGQAELVQYRRRFQKYVICP